MGKVGVGLMNPPQQLMTSSLQSPGGDKTPEKLLERLRAFFVEKGEAWPEELRC